MGKTYKFIYVLLVYCHSCQNTDSIYPFFPKEAFAETIHDTLLIDDFRHLENLKDPEVQSWFRQQEDLAQKTLERIPNQDRFLEKIKTIDYQNQSNYDKVQIQKDGSYFFLKKSEDDPYGDLYYKPSASASEIILFSRKENNYNEDHISYFKTNWDLSKIAIALTKNGEDQSKILIIDLNTNEMQDPKIENVNPSKLGGISWLPSNNAFTYIEVPHFNYDDANYLKNTKGMVAIQNDATYIKKEVLSHKKNPSVIKSPADFPILRVPTSTSNYLIAFVSGASRYEDTYMSPLSSTSNLTSLEWKLLFEKKEQVADFEFLGTNIIYRTSLNASNFELKSRPVEIDSPSIEDTILIGELENEVLRDFTVLKDEIFYTTLKNGVQAKLYKLDKKNNRIPIDLPYDAGNCYLVSDEQHVYTLLNGWITNNRKYRLDTIENSFHPADLKGQSTNYKDDFVVEELEVPSHDGVLVPLSIIRKKTTRLDSRNPTLILSYGSYGGNMSPFFYAPYIVWMEEGGIFAIAHIRGGGEKGDTWHQDGMKLKKSNSWKDLIACSEFLIDKNYTSPDYLINTGTSAGGIPVGRSIIERPDLYRVAIMNVPALNMVRSEFQPNGANSTKEFGTIKNPQEFRALLDMDVYMNLKLNVNYPSILVSTGMNDGTVTPWDPGKFVAKAQSYSNSKSNPILFSVDFNAGHGGDGSMESFYKQNAKEMAFAFWQTGHPDFQPEDE